MKLHGARLIASAIVAGTGSITVALRDDAVGLGCGLGLLSYGVTLFSIEWYTQRTESSARDMPGESEIRA